MTFHLTCVHIIFNSVWVAEGATFLEIAAHSIDHMFSFVIIVISRLVLRARFEF